MNRYARMMLDKRMDGSGRYTTYRDGRNPYGSRGGYVTDRQDRTMRDYGYESDYGYDTPRYDYRRDDEPYRRQDYERDYRDYERYDQPRRDYGSHSVKFSREDAEEWKHKMQNEDGTVGEHFRQEQIKRVAEQQGINIDELGGMDVFCLAINMMYSDYCNVARKYGTDRIEFYADLAKAFLKDKDFDGSPEEKLYLYYRFIVDDEQ